MRNSRAVAAGRPKLVSEIIAGKAPVEPETALQFERVLGMAASVWLNLEANYQLHIARQLDEEEIPSRNCMGS